VDYRFGTVPDLLRSDGLLVGIGLGRASIEALPGPRAKG